MSAIRTSRAALAGCPLDRILPSSHARAASDRVLKNLAAQSHLSIRTEAMSLSSYTAKVVSAYALDRQRLCSVRLHEYVIPVDADQLQGRAIGATGGNRSSAATTCHLPPRLTQVSVHTNFPGVPSFFFQLSLPWATAISP